MASWSIPDHPSSTIENIYNCHIAYAAHPAARECNSYGLCTELLIVFHRTKVAGSNRGELAIMIASPQSTLRDGSVPDLGTYLTQPSSEDGGPSRRRPGRPGEAGPYWEIKRFVDYKNQSELYGKIYAASMEQLARYPRQVFADFPSRRAYYSFFSAGIDFSLLLWPHHKSRSKFDASRIEVTWVEDVVVKLKAALEEEFSNWNDSFLEETRGLTGNSKAFRGLEEKLLRAVTVDKLFKLSPIPIYWGEHMFVGTAQQRAVSPQMRNALSVAHSLPELGLQYRECPDFDIPDDPAEYSPTAGTLDNACLYTAKAVFKIHVINVWAHGFDELRPTGGSTASSNDNYRGVKQFGNMYQPYLPVTRTCTRVSTAGANGGPAQGEAGPGPSTLANRRQTRNRR